MNESFDFTKVAQQSCGAVWYRHGKTILLASVAVDEDKTISEDFLPLTVQYIEKTYANAKFPSGFIKRESKPSDFETLTSRIIDRTLRPLFPKGYAYPTQISVIVLSYDGVSDLQVCALQAASSALYVSGLPFNYPVNAVRIGKKQGAFIINPSMQDLQESSLDLYISGCNEDILMIEMRSMQGETPNELSEEELYRAIEVAKTAIAQKSQQMMQAFQNSIHSPMALDISVENLNAEIVDFVWENYYEALDSALKQMAKSERASQLHKLALEIQRSVAWSFEEIVSALEFCKKRRLREMILKEQKRADGRRLDEVREIAIETNLLPCAHGSCLFKRGQTQALVVSTLGSDNDAQSYELLGDKTSSKERFMVHYNFPSFSVGEASMIGAPGRRELGHGNLAKRALESSIKDRRVIRLVSEILESNGSSSMATVCGGSLALLASGVETYDMVAGVAMGLVKEGDDFAILTDIMGLEDHCGDMDFKIAGTRHGITALQMDIKLGGIDLGILKQALNQAKRARLHILDIMQEARNKIQINEEIVPLIISFDVPADRMVEIIGQGGKIIKEIIERLGVNIDLDRTIGEVRISGLGRERLESAKEYILELLKKNQSKNFSCYSVGMEFEGCVKKIVDFGAFVEMPNGGDGLLHISKMRAKKAELCVGDIVSCRILAIGQNKIELDLI
ncbi:polyribonucleotide nucleotidyltransferase [Helicobacter kayseriensis]|uniref:polyribonucleotide nucleotidyltransferase n=1 Tax=Helicobacter kayseriensis TaxID=2905877 RepID=UPI001E3E5B79|nr:polyribonucleotide nucleotidyltransferase [Helicobacter kayseriensis]MCE3047370.1 polyribonucleotide nucleotidyltransferase [Helicobacter kayseriensis]MCE3048741.1 polyribonucleotide nucleotidyltransferase [Helicobacter kayseriensis]